ncbi:MAG TPA: DUF4340 domain-containing protein [Candidatus Methylomirabilis sp.]|nr:DUF4340 domain-containing protein [Candidatus Methylomirabilis sp.]
MKGYGLLVAAGCLAILSGVLYWSNHRKPKVESDVKVSADTPPKILDLKQDDITKIDIKKKGSDDVELSKDGSGKWQIVAPKAYRADQETVSSLVSTLSSLNSDRLLEAKATNQEQYGLAPADYEIDVQGKDNGKHTLLVGDDAPAGNDAYAALAGDPRVFMVASYNKTSLEKSLNDLRDKRLLVFDTDKLSRVELDAKKQVMEFGRNKDQWQIVKPQPFRADSSQVDDLIRRLSDAKMDLTVSAEDQKKAAAAFASGTAVATAKLTDAAGTQELQVRKNKTDYYAKSSEVEGIYKVGNDLGLAVDKGVDDFRTKKLFDLGFNDPDKIEFQDGPKTYFLTKGGQDWWLPDGKKADAIPAETFVEKVRDLSATKFPDSGFTASAMELTSTSNSGKTVEKVLIAKNGDQYIAKRENEPALYELDSTVVKDLEKAADDLKPVPQPVLPSAGKPKK